MQPVIIRLTVSAPPNPRLFISNSSTPLLEAGSNDWLPHMTVTVINFGRFNDTAPLLVSAVPPHF